jgi:D-alanyl-D-alanine dipeptidase
MTMTHPETGTASVRAAQRRLHGRVTFTPVVRSHEPVLLSDPSIAAIVPVDCGEPMVDAREELRFDRRLADRDGLYGHLRAGVVERLVAAEALLPKGLQLLLIEGYRPPGLQRRYFEDYRLELRAAHPDWDEARSHAEASKFVSPPDVAPHQTGGAVDLTLCHDNGVELDLGTAVNASPQASGDRCFTGSRHITARAHELRGELGRVLTSVGLVNYPTEWWHWSYGERYWAHAHGFDTTRYAPIATTVPRPRR